MKWQQHLTLALPEAKPDSIWIHACSVGEVGSVVPLVHALLARGHGLHVTVVTRTGYAHARRLLGEEVSVSYLPWDIPGLMARFVSRLRPRALLLTETEFWPGMLRACARRHIPVIGINTRISDRSFPRYLATRWLWRRVLAAVEVFLPQGNVDAERLRQLGVAATQIGPVGNLKYAVMAPKVDASALRWRLDGTMQRPVLLLASTHEDEERRLLKMLPRWLQHCPGLLPVLVPRHPERFDQVAAEVCRQGFSLHRWSQGDVITAPDVLLVDAMGVLTSLYAVADMVFIGGSLVNIGGHNPLEAAVCGRGVITGPHIQNFREVMQCLQHDEAAVVVADDDELCQAIKRFLQHPAELERLHAAAAGFMQRQQGVLEQVLAVMDEYLEHSA